MGLKLGKILAPLDICDHPFFSSMPGGGLNLRPLDLEFFNENPTMGISDQC